MRRTALREYLSRIEGLLDDNRLPEAAAHCHFILQQYPRHIDTYRLFGRTLLEQQLFDEAKDVFARLLSADPEDLVSHAGLALAYSESRDFDLAIWHMERAFEIDPYNRAVQSELRRLYIDRDGDAPSRMALSRPALARLYLRGAMYRQATSELTFLSAKSPDRFDLQLALADSLFWGSRQVEAAEVCQKILVHLPFCIKANAILADVWLRADRVGEAREHLRRVQELTLLDQAHLDPDSTLGRAVSNSRIELPESIQVEILEDSLAIAYGLGEADAQPHLPAAAEIDDDQAPEWLLEIGGDERALQVDGGLGSELEEVVDWLEDVTTADGERKAEPGEESQPADESTLTTIDETEDLPPEQAKTIEAAPLDELELLMADLDGSSEPTQSDLEVVQSEPLDHSAEQVDEAAMALDDLLANIDAGDDDAESGPSWLEELDDGPDVSDELPDWLYEAVGFDEPDEAGYEGDLLGSFDASLAQETDIGDDKLDQPETDFGPADRFETAAGSFDREHHQVDSAYESDSAKLPQRDEVPDWLLDADDVLEDLPAELHGEAAAGQSNMPKDEEEMVTWLDELSDQLGENADKPGESGAPRDE
ncbi:MAG: tetratricopeptide repeat protein [Chloroflexota bacterium]|nr:MAG: tetratricopeptide repeat protein [Chloroflexota bacterium]